MAFHAELRQGRNVARGFNLSEEDVRTRFLRPLQAGEEFMFQDKDWEPRKTQLTVIEGAELRPGQLSLGQGWTNAVKHGTNVTERFVNPAPAAAGAPGAPGEVTRLKERILGRTAAGPLALGETLSLSADMLKGHRVSERLGVAELAVWELLHAGSIVLQAGADQAPLVAEEWETVLLASASWLSRDGDAPLIRANA